MTRDTTHFKVREFSCRCGCGRAPVKQELLNTLEVIRLEWGKPIAILSGYRCPDHNRHVGGVPHSPHVSGEAADIGNPRGAFSREERKQIVALIERLYAEGQLPHLGGLGWKQYRNGCVHVDVRKAADGHLRRW